MVMNVGVVAAVRRGDERDVASRLESRSMMLKEGRSRRRL
jgi:hypothetical protein